MNGGFWLEQVMEAELILLRGTHALYFAFESESRVQFAEFAFV